MLSSSGLLREAEAVAATLKPAVFLFYDLHCATHLNPVQMGQRPGFASVCQKIHKMLRRATKRSYTFFNIMSYFGPVSRRHARSSQIHETLPSCIASTLLTMYSHELCRFKSGTQFELDRGLPMMDMVHGRVTYLKHAEKLPEQTHLDCADLSLAQDVGRKSSHFPDILNVYHK